MDFVAVVVTHDRPALLGACLQALEVGHWLHPGKHVQAVYQALEWSPCVWWGLCE